MNNTRLSSLGLIRLLSSQGIELPAEMARAGNPAKGIPSGIECAADDLAELLNDAGCTCEHAREAVKTYLREPNATQFRKPYPDVGMILARTPHAVMEQIAAKAEKSEATTIFHAVMAARSSYGPGYIGPVVNIIGREGDTGLEEAIAAGVAALGGWRALGAIQDTEKGYRARDFAEAFGRAREKARTVRALGGVDRLRLVAK